MCCREWSAVVNAELSWGGWGGIRSHWQVSWSALSCRQFINEEFVYSQSCSLQLLYAQLAVKLSIRFRANKTAQMQFASWYMTYMCTVAQYKCMFVGADYSLQSMESSQQFVIMVTVVQKLRLGCGPFFKYLGCGPFFICTFIIYSIKNDLQPNMSFWNIITIMTNFWALSIPCKGMISTHKHAPGVVQLLVIKEYLTE